MILPRHIQRDGVLVPGVFLTLLCLHALFQECNEPPTVPNAIVNAGTRTIGSKRQYACNTGYAVKGTTPVITCKPDSNWTPAEFECIIDSVCPQDPLAFHHAVLQDGIVVKFRAFYDAPTDFNGAHAKCATVGGGLYQILTVAKMNFTLQFMACPAFQSKSFWIDGMYNQNTSVWKTMDGTPLPMSKDFWLPVTLNDNINNGPTCVWMYSVFGYKWDDSSGGCF